MGISVRLLAAPYYFPENIGDFYHAQYVAEAAGSVHVYCHYAVDSTNENNWMYMQGWIDGLSEYSAGDTLFGNTSRTWDDRFPLSAGKGMMILVNQNNSGADPHKDRVPVVEFLSQRVIDQSAKQPGIEVPDIGAPPSDTRYSEDIPFQSLQYKRGFYWAAFVAPVAGTVELDYFVHLTPSDYACQGQSMIWCDGDLVYEDHREMFGSAEFSHKKTRNLQKGEMVTFFIHEFNLNATPSGNRMRARFYS